MNDGKKYIITIAFALISLVSLSISCLGNTEWNSQGESSQYTIDSTSKIFLYADISDDTALNYAWIETNETGVWVNRTGLISNYYSLPVEDTYFSTYYGTENYGTSTSIYYAWSTIAPNEFSVTMMKFDLPPIDNKSTVISSNITYRVYVDNNYDNINYTIWQNYNQSWQEGSITGQNYKNSTNAGFNTTKIYRHMPNTTSNSVDENVDLTGMVNDALNRGFDNMTLYFNTTGNVVDNVRYNTHSKESSSSVYWLPHLNITYQYSYLFANNKPRMIANFTWSNSSITEPKVIAWRIYFNDTSGNMNVTPIMTFITNNNSYMSYQNQSQNSSIVLQSGALSLSANISSSTTLKYAWLSTNETGIWENKTIQTRDVISNFNQTSKYIGWTLKSGMYAFQTFRMYDSSNYFSNVTLELYREPVSSPTGIIYISLHKIDGTLVEDLGTVDISTLPTAPSYGDYVFNSTLNPLLIENERYYFNVTPIYYTNANRSSIMSYPVYITDTFGYGYLYQSYLDNIPSDTDEDGNYYDAYFIIKFTNSTYYKYVMPFDSTGFQWFNVTWSNSSAQKGKVVGWKIYFNDSIGNESSTSIMNFTIDSAGYIAIQNPQNTTYPNLTIPINFTISNNMSSLYNCWYSINDTKNITLDGCSNATISTPNSQNKITIYANTTNGDINYTVRYFISSSMPSITVGYPENNTLYGSRNVSFNFSSDQIGVLWYNLNNTGNTTACPSCSQYNGTFDLMMNGTHNVTFYVNNTFGLESSALIIFMVNTSFPDINIISPIESSYTSGVISINVNTSVNATINYTYCTRPACSDSSENITLCTNCNSASGGNVLSDGNYRIRIYANNSIGTSTKYVDFSVSSPIAIPPSSGGSGNPIVRIFSGNWSIQQADYYIIAPPNTSTKKSITIDNKLSDNVTEINVECIASICDQLNPCSCVNICEYVTFGDRVVSMGGVSTLQAYTIPSGQTGEIEFTINFTSEYATEHSLPMVQSCDYGFSIKITIGGESHPISVHIESFPGSEQIGKFIGWLDRKTWIIPNSVIMAFISIAVIMSPFFAYRYLKKRR